MEGYAVVTLDILGDFLTSKYDKDDIYMQL